MNTLGTMSITEEEGIIVFVLGHHSHFKKIVEHVGIHFKLFSRLNGHKSLRVSESEIS